MPSAKPGKTKPSLRPDAFQATRRVSSNATDQPRRAISRAVVRPASPAPITQTSTSRSKVSRPLCGAGIMVALYQLEPYGARSEEHTSELQSHVNLVCRLLLEKKKKT